MSAKRAGAVAGDARSTKTVLLVAAQGLLIGGLTVLTLVRGRSTKG